MIVTELPVRYDVDRLWQACSALIERYGWGSLGQIGLTHRPETVDPVERLFGGVGSLSRQADKPKERDFTVLNELCHGTYIEEVYHSLPYAVGRMRIMRIEGRRCYSVHRDSSMRIHLPLVTNPEALMLFPDDGLIVHLPADGRIFLTDTTRRHSAMNGGLMPRYHLLAALCEPCDVTDASASS